MAAVTPPAREIALLAVVLAGLARLIDGPPAWAVAALVFAMVVAALSHARTGATHRAPGRRPLVPPPGVVGPLILPGLAAAAPVGALHLVPIDLRLVLGLAAAWLLIRLALAAEFLGGRFGVGAIGPSDVRTPEALERSGDADAEGTYLLPLSLVVALAAFVGVAALVPGGLAGSVGVSPQPGLLGPGPLVALAVGDAIVGGLVGYRLAALHTGDTREAAFAGLTYAAIVGISAAALRAMQVPRFIGPAVLALLVYLWSAYRGSAPATRRSARWVWETALLGLLAVLVVAWNLAARA